MGLPWFDLEPSFGGPLTLLGESFLPPRVFRFPLPVRQPMTSWTKRRGPESSIRRERVQRMKECETFNATWLTVLPVRHP